MLIQVLHFLLSCVPSHKDWQEGDAGGKDPGNADHKHGGFYIDGHVVLQWVGDCIVSTHAYTTEMQCRHSGNMYIHGVPKVAHKAAKVPLSSYLYCGIECHCKYSHK